MTILVILFIILALFSPASSYTLNKRFNFKSLQPVSLEIKYQTASKKIFSSKNSFDENIIENDDSISKSNSKRIIYGLLWSGLVYYAFNISPGGTSEAQMIDQEIISKVLRAPFDGSISPLFIGVFNALGILPATYASLLLCGSKNQKIPALPFVISSFFLGFFGIGPYLLFRKQEINVTKQDLGT